MIFKNYSDIMLTIIAVLLLLIVYNDYGLPQPKWFKGKQLPERVWVMGGSLWVDGGNIDIENIYPIDVKVTNPDDIAYENWLKLDGMSVTTY